MSSDDFCVVAFLVMPRIILSAAKITRFLRDPDAQRIGVGIMPVELARAVRSRVRIIQLYSGTANKICFEHKILPEHFAIIPLMMEMAWVGSDRQRHMTFLLYDQHVFNKTFKLVIKSNRQGRELIVATFHKIEAVHVGRLKRRCAKIRDGII